MIQCLLFLLGLALLIQFDSTPALAARIGDPAPALGEMGRPLRGPHVDVQDGKRLYVITYWRPTRYASDAIPYLGQIQRQYTNGEIGCVAIAARTSPQTEPYVQYFWMEQETNMQYTVVRDDADHFQGRYMQGIVGPHVGAGWFWPAPHTFIVGTNRVILWHGPPLEGLSKALQQILSGSYDIQAAKAHESFLVEVREFSIHAYSNDSDLGVEGEALLQKAGKNINRLVDFLLQANVPITNQTGRAVLDRAYQEVSALLPTNDYRTLMVSAKMKKRYWGDVNQAIALAQQALKAASTEEERISCRGYCDYLVNPKAWSGLYPVLSAQQLAVPSPSRVYSITDADRIADMEDEIRRGKLEIQEYIEKLTGSPMPTPP